MIEILFCLIGNIYTTAVLKRDVLFLKLEGTFFFALSLNRASYIASIRQTNQNVRSQANQNVTLWSILAPFTVQGERFRQFKGWRSYYPEEFRYHKFTFEAID